MKDAKSLLLEVLAAIPDGEKVAPLFAEDGVVELPFLHSVGIEPRYKGRAAIAGFYDVVKQLYPDLVFKPEDTHVLIEHDGARADGQILPGPPPRLSSDGRAGGERGSALGLLSRFDRYFGSAPAHGCVVSPDRQNAYPRRDGV
jgi:hypothetical protein